MILLDTNYILRFLLKDDDEMYEVSKSTIQNNNCFIDNEVLAEVVFVLLKVYKIPKNDISTTLEKFLSLPNITLDSKTTLLSALPILPTF